MRLIRSLSLLFLSLACSLTTPPSISHDVPTQQLSNNYYLATPTQIPVPTPHTIPATCTVLAQALHLRECAGLHCTVLTWLSKGDVLEVLDADQDWIKVTTPAGQSGWVHSKYCGGSK
ncbi:MAG: SH3 domain-containing protein [Chloroflexi bacterium]|nr:SH3 domain-containing protein [Chloroflexota bacterium]